MSGTRGSAAPLVYASVNAYAAHGAVRQVTLGNGLVEQTSFNTRLQPTAITLGSAAGQPNRLWLHYAYGTTNNNGNVLSQTITVPGLSPPLVQTYEYDAVNRLSEASESSNGVQSWQQLYRYDRFGNRRFKAGTTLPASLNIEQDALNNPTTSPATNRFAAGQGYGYDNGVNDSAGNLTSAPGYSYSYDGENRIVTANPAPPNQQANPHSYVYDGDGRRVQKITANGQEVTVFVYDVMGQMVCEYSNLLPASENQTSYLTSDTLGTPRVITKADGSVKSRHDYLPFGEEIGSNIGGRSAVPQYSAADGVKQKFTGKERDNETELDYSINRYYSSAQGRFTSPDPLLESGEPLQPQSWNRYSYTINNPLKFVDPDGLRYVQRTLADGSIQYGWCATDECYDNAIDNNAKGYAGWTAVTFDESKTFEYTCRCGSGGDLYGGYRLNPDGTHGNVNTLDGNYHAMSTDWNAQLAIGSLFKSLFSLADAGISAFTRQAAATAASEAAGAWPGPGSGRVIIRGIEYTEHALERMAPKGLIQQGTKLYSRGVPPSVVENAIQNGVKSAGNQPGTVMHIFENIRVVTNAAANRVITVYVKSSGQ